MNLIDRDNLHITVQYERMNGKRDVTKALKEAIENAIAEMPTVDAVPVIKCQNCKYWKTVIFRDVAEYGICDVHPGLHTEPFDGFCHHAERVEE